MIEIGEYLAFRFESADSLLAQHRGVKELYGGLLLKGAVGPLSKVNTAHAAVAQM